MARNTQITNNVQLPSIHAMVNDVAPTSDALDRFRIDGSGKNSLPGSRNNSIDGQNKLPKLEPGKQLLGQGPLPLPSFTDVGGHTSFKSEYSMNSFDRPFDRQSPEMSSPPAMNGTNASYPLKAVEPSFNQDVCTPYYQPYYWESTGVQAQAQAQAQARAQAQYQSGSPTQNGLQPGPHPHHYYPYSESPGTTSSSTSSSTANSTSSGNGVQLQRIPSNDDSSSEAPVKRRANLPKSVTTILRQWLHEHVDNPYPSEEDKHRLMKETGLTLVQVSNWFINARRRVLHSTQRKGKYRNLRQPGTPHSQTASP